jgi:hypothetical protein
MVQMNGGIPVASFIGIVVGHGGGAEAEEIVTIFGGINSLISYPEFITQDLDGILMKNTSIIFNLNQHPQRDAFLDRWNCLFSQHLF